MPRLIESTFVTLDGVISESEVWGSPYWDEEHHDYADKLLFDADGLVLGRHTYESFAVGRLADAHHGDVERERPVR